MESIELGTIITGIPELLSIEFSPDGSTLASSSVLSYIRWLRERKFYIDGVGCKKWIKD